MNIFEPHGPYLSILFVGLHSFFTHFEYQIRIYDLIPSAKLGSITYLLSHILFCCVLAWVIKKTEQEVRSGYRIGSKLLAHLAYSDDKVLLGENQSDQQKYLKVFVRNAGEVDLKINLSKTKCLVVSKNNN